MFLLFSRTGYNTSIILCQDQNGTTERGARIAQWKPVVWIGRSTGAVNTKTNMGRMWESNMEMDQAGWCSSKIVDLCSEGAWFESWPGHRLALRFSWFLSVPPGKCNISIRPLPLKLSSLYYFNACTVPFVVRQSPYHRRCIIVVTWQHRTVWSQNIM